MPVPAQGGELSLGVLTVVASGDREQVVAQCGPVQFAVPVDNVRSALTTLLGRRTPEAIALKMMLDDVKANGEDAKLAMGEWLAFP